MSLDLSVYPQRFPKLDHWFVLCDLPFEDDRRLFDLIEAFESYPLAALGYPHIEKIEEEGGIERRSDDHYGVPFRYVLAGSFRSVPPEGWAAWNVAVLAFLRALPPDRPVILDWS